MIGLMGSCSSQLPALLASNSTDHSAAHSVLFSSCPSYSPSETSNRSWLASPVSPFPKCTSKQPVLEAQLSVFSSSSWSTASYAVSPVLKLPLDAFGLSLGMAVFPDLDSSVKSRPNTTCRSMRSSSMSLCRSCSVACTLAVRPLSMPLSGLLSSAWEAVILCPSRYRSSGEDKRSSMESFTRESSGLSAMCELILGSLS